MSEKNFTVLVALHQPLTLDRFEVFQQIPLLHQGQIVNRLDPKLIKHGGKKVIRETRQV